MVTRMSGNAKDSPIYDELYEAIAVSRKAIPCVFLQCVHPRLDVPPVASDVMPANNAPSLPHILSGLVQPFVFAPVPIPASLGQHGLQNEHLVPGHQRRASAPAGLGDAVVRPIYQAQPVPPGNNGYPPPNTGHTQQQLNTLFSETNIRRINQTNIVFNPRQMNYHLPNQLPRQAQFGAGRGVPIQQGPIHPADPDRVGFTNPNVVENGGQILGQMVVDLNITPRPRNGRHNRARYPRA
jgi:hypothetical protein